MIRDCGTNGLIHSDGGRQSISGIMDMIRRYFSGFGTDKKEGVKLFALNFDISFIAGLGIIYRAFVM